MALRKPCLLISPREFILIISFSLCLLIPLWEDNVLPWCCVLALARLKDKRISLCRDFLPPFPHLHIWILFRDLPTFQTLQAVRNREHCVMLAPHLLSELPQQFIELLREVSVRSGAQCFPSFTNNGEIMRLVIKIVILVSGVCPAFQMLVFHNVANEHWKGTSTTQFRCSVWVLLPLKAFH